MKEGNTWAARGTAKRLRPHPGRKRHRDDRRIMDRKTIGDEAVIFINCQADALCSPCVFDILHHIADNKMVKVETATSRECQAVVFLVMNVDEICESPAIILIGNRQRIGCVRIPLYLGLNGRRFLAKNRINSQAQQKRLHLEQESLVYAVTSNVEIIPL